MTKTKNRHGRITQTSSTIIETVEQLKAYLQTAVQLEHATIPPYLTAAYSAKIEANKASSDIIRAVAKEEMLHFALAANLLNAIGGQPDLLKPGFVPHYPTYLPTGQDDFNVGIERFSNHTLQTFLDIERPSSPNLKHAKIVRQIKKTIPIASRHIDKSLLKDSFVPIKKVGGKYELHYTINVIPHNHLTRKRRRISEERKSLIPHVPPKSSENNPIQLHYWSIGEFYKAIHLGFVELTNKIGEKALFSGDSSKQVPPKSLAHKIEKASPTGDSRKQIPPQSYYSAGGELKVVTNLKTALAAIDFIAGQGEGGNDSVYDDQNELAHYYRFDQIQKKRYYQVPAPDGKNRDKAGHPRGGRFPVTMKAVFPIKANAKVADYHDDLQLEERALLFNGQYKRFLEKLNTAFNGKPDILIGAFFRAEMFSIKVAMEKLIHYEILGTGECASPTFEMDRFKYPPHSPTSPSLASAKGGTHG